MVIRRKGHLESKSGKQLTVRKQFPEKILKVKSAQVRSQSEVIFCERDNEVAFIFESDNKYYTPEFQEDGKPQLKVYKTLPNDDELQFFKWSFEDETIYLRLTYKKFDKFLCCDEHGNVFLGPTTSTTRVDSYQWKRTYMK